MNGRTAFVLAEIGFSGLKVSAILGVLENERHEEQSVLIDLSVWVDISESAANDDLNASLDYRVLAEEVREIAVSVKRFTIEALTDDILKNVFAKHPKVEKAKVRISKPSAIPDAESTFVVLKRKRPKTKKERKKS